MSQTRATVLTVERDRRRRRRTVTYRNVRYGVTWNRLRVAHADGTSREFDLWNVADYQATNRAA